MARVEYKDGIYYGELVNGKRQGFGKMTFDKASKRRTKKEKEVEETPAS